MTTIINDLHLGARRQGGTTPQSQAELRVWQYEQLDRLLAQSDEHLIVLGDMFDAFSVDPSDVILTFNVLADWLNDGQRRHMLTLVCGNHDHNPRGGKTSSFHLLAHFMRAQFGERVQVIDYEKGLTRDRDLWVIPHMPNQDLFNIELEKALAVEQPTFLLLHANYNNTFAQHSDHSLNVSQEQVDRLMLAGWTLVFAHEHQSQVLRGGRVIIIGNQIPTSCADLIGCKGKNFLRINGAESELVEFMTAGEVFSEIDWRDLTPSDAKFIRVTGSATADEAAAAVDAVAKYRQQSGAFVVTNAVKVDGVAGFDQLAEMSLENITSFNVLDSLLEELSEAEGKVVKELLNA